MEGLLKRYGNLLSGYKTCYARLIEEECCLLISKVDQRSLSPNPKINSKEIEKINLSNARILIMGNEVKLDQDYTQGERHRNSTNPNNSSSTMVTQSRTESFLT
jgi:hypothetical protein